MKTGRVELVKRNAPWAEYQAACFLPTCPELFLCLDRYSCLQARDLATKVTTTLVCENSFIFIFSE
jgi:hypothetical protein